MMMQFATCERQRALDFIRKLFPSREIQETGVIVDVLDLVESDKIRVLDPDFHAGAITQSKATDAEWSEMQVTLQKMISEIMVLPKVQGEVK